MCGIVGCIGGHHERAVIDEAVDRLRHRGPDDRGVERFSGDVIAAGDPAARLVHPAALDPLRRTSYLDLRTFLPNLNLAYTDRASMATFLDGDGDGAAPVAA